MKPNFNKEILQARKENLRGLNTAEVSAQLKKDAQEANTKKGLFIVKTGAEWVNEAKNRPQPKMLFGEFWHEGELCILFADTNVGKSILAVQIGNSIATGVPIHGFTLEAEKQKVLYLDFELSDKQFEVRYSVNYTDHYQWSENFLRAEFDPDTDLINGKFEELLHASLETAIKDTGIKILIVDNITYLKNETEKAKDALPLMKQLKALKKKFHISILALAHTPKRELNKPITRNDLQGSKMLINFCDSSFAIGECHSEKGGRFLKQIKARNTEFKYDSENVAFCQINKPHNFLLFEFQHYANELDLLINGENSFDEKRVIARQMKEDGYTVDEIRDRLSVSKGWVSKATRDITAVNGRSKAGNN